MWRPGCLPFPSSDACWDTLQPPLSKEKKIMYGKWLNERITVNDVKYLIEEGFKRPCASAWAFIGKHHLPINKCVGNKCDRRGELWTSSINHGCPWFCLFPRLFSACLLSFLLQSLSLHNMFPFSLKSSHHSPCVSPAVVISFMSLLLLSSSLFSFCSI